MRRMKLSERMRLLVPIVTAEQRRSAHECLRKGAIEIDKLEAELVKAKEELRAAQDQLRKLGETI